MDDLTSDPLGLRSKQEIGMGRCGGRVPDDEEGDVDLVGVGEDRVGFKFDGFTGGQDDFSAVELFLKVRRRGSGQAHKEQQRDELD